jgi:hypothetical protein
MIDGDIAESPAPPPPDLGQSGSSQLMRGKETNPYQELEKLGVKISAAEPTPGHQSHTEARVFEVPLSSSGAVNPAIEVVLLNIKTPHDFTFFSELSTETNTFHDFNLRDPDEESEVPPNLARALQLALRLNEFNIQDRAQKITLTVCPSAWSW